MTTATEAAIARVKQRRKPGPPPGTGKGKPRGTPRYDPISIEEVDDELAALDARDDPPPAAANTAKPNASAEAPNADRHAEHHAATTEHHTMRTPERERPRIRTRHSTVDYNTMDDEFYVNLAAVPSDTSVEWKRLSNVGEENPFYIAKMQTQGWWPVDPREHPDWVPVPPGYDKPQVIKNGQILMERPKQLTDEARRDDRINAAKRMREAEQRLGKAPKGTGPRDADDSIKPRVIREMGRMVEVEGED